MVVNTITGKMPGKYTLQSWLWNFTPPIPKPPIKSIGLSLTTLPSGHYEIVMSGCHSLVGGWCKGTPLTPLLFLLHPGPLCTFWSSFQKLQKLQTTLDHSRRPPELPLYIQAPLPGTPLYSPLPCSFLCMCLIILAGFPQSILFGSPLASLSDFLSTERLPLHKVTIKLHLRLICKPFSPYSFISCQLPSCPSIIHYHMYEQLLLLPKCLPYTYCMWGHSFCHHVPCHRHGEQTWQEDWFWFLRWASSSCLSFFHLNSGLTLSVSGGICGINIIFEEEVGIKPKSVNAKHPQIEYESKVYKTLAGGVGVLVSDGSELNVIIMLWWWTFCVSCSRTFSSFATVNSAWRLYCSSQINWYGWGVCLAIAMIQHKLLYLADLTYWVHSLQKLHSQRHQAQQLPHGHWQTW